jgi:hypothetical protein
MDRQRLIEKITVLDGAVIKKIEDGVMFILGIKKILKSPAL